MVKKQNLNINTYGEFLCSPFFYFLQLDKSLYKNKNGAENCAAFIFTKY